MLCPKISTSWKKLAPTGRHGRHVFVTLKEGERVTLGHFHERVGESPRREKNFGTSGSKIPRFVSEIWLFEVGISVRPD